MIQFRITNSKNELISRISHSTRSLNYYPNLPLAFQRLKELQSAESAQCANGILHEIEDNKGIVYNIYNSPNNIPGYCLAGFGETQTDLFIKDIFTEEVLYEYSVPLNLQEMMFELVPRLNQEGHCHKGMLFGSILPNKENIVTSYRGVSTIPN